LARFLASYAAASDLSMSRCALSSAVFSMMVHASSRLSVTTA
jgi:hypothetical protein